MTNRIDGDPRLGQRCPNMLITVVQLLRCQQTARRVMAIGRGQPASPLYRGSEARTVPFVRISAVRATPGPDDNSEACFSPLEREKFAAYVNLRNAPAIEA